MRRDGKVVAALGPGDVFGEIGVLEKTLRNADVVATSPLRLVTLSRFDVKRVPEAAERIRSRAETYPSDGQ